VDGGEARAQHHERAHSLAPSE